MLKWGDAFKRNLLIVKKPMSEQGKQNIRNARTGTKHSAETIQKIRENHKGGSLPGIKLSEEHKQKISESRRETKPHSPEANTKMVTKRNITTLYKKIAKDIGVEFTKDKIGEHPKEAINHPLYDAMMENITKLKSL